MIEPIRHVTLFDPLVWGNRSVHIIGCGASGSHLAQEVGRLGVLNLNLHDDDSVSAENIANQLYPHAAIGMPKVEVCRNLLRAAAGISPEDYGKPGDPHIHGKCDGDRLGDLVFLCVDSMAARKDILARSLRLKATTEYVIDTRMGVEELRVYGFCPNVLSEVKRYEGTLTDDADTPENACHTKITIGATAAIVAGVAVHYMIQWYRHAIVHDPAYASAPAFESMVMLRPIMGFVS